MKQASCVASMQAFNNHLQYYFTKKYFDKKRFPKSTPLTSFPTPSFFAIIHQMYSFIISYGPEKAQFTPEKEGRNAKPSLSSGMNFMSLPPRHARDMQETEAECQRYMKIQRRCTVKISSDHQAQNGLLFEDK